MSIIEVNGQFPASASTDDQVSVAIVVQITPGQPGSKLAEFLRQQRLAGEIVVRIIMVRVLEQLAYVFEESSRFWFLVSGFWSVRGSWSVVRWWRRRLVALGH